MKRILSLLLSVVMIMTALSFVTCAEDGLTDSGIDYTESTEIIGNPNMGYPAHASITLSDSFTPRNDSGFTWYYVNLNYYSAGNGNLPASEADRRGFTPREADAPISDSALEAFRGTLENLRQNGGSCFIRFVYDWNGVTGCEPASIDTIFTHIEQLCGVVADFADVCFGFECGVIGVFGEMHSSIYCGAEYANPIIDAYLDNTPDTMTLMVRTPVYIANYLGITREELATLVTEEGSPEYRLSYYNDGYMNSDNDLGTWTDRATDIQFLSRQSEHNAYGGEFGSAYWELPCDSCLPENAIPEMYSTHLSFIRGNVYSTSQNEYFGYDSYTYGTEYEKDWYPDNSAFYGVDCHQFIVSHLGYRLVVRESLLSASPKAGGTLTLKGRIENTGFGNVNHRPVTQILLVGNGYTYVCDTAIKAADFRSCAVTDYATTLNLPASMPAGEYKVYMRMTASTDTDFLSVKSSIRFANTGDIYDDELGGNYIGTVNVAAGEGTSIANDVFCEVGAAVSGGRTTVGAPLLFGYGMSEGNDVYLNYHTGDTLTLSAWNMLRSDASVTYKWYKDADPQADEIHAVGTEATLVVESLTADDAGAYTLTVKTGAESFTTATVYVTVDEHIFGGYTTVTPATCHTVGSESRTCSHCDLTESRVIPTTAHTEGAPVTVPSTCTVRGRESVSCTECADVLDFKLLDLAPHDCETVINEATCLADGSKTDSCVNCDYTVTETLPALGHNYIYSISGKDAVGTCSRCGGTTDTLTFDGYTGEYAGVADFDNNKGAMDADSAPLTLIGEGGYLTEYDAKGASYVTLVFRVEGVTEPMKLGKFRITAYASDYNGALGDSNNAGNYYGTLLYTVDGDGVYALTLRKYLMLPYGNGGWGVITHAAFNDPDMTKGSDPVNSNEDATVELLGVYNGMVSYHLLYTDGEGNFLESREGTYNPDVVWSNKMEGVATVDSLFGGELPAKPATKDKIYTFSHWADADGNAVELAIGNYILSPVFIESDNPCDHADTVDTVLTAPTCTADGEGMSTCADCGILLEESYVIPAAGHAEVIDPAVPATCTEGGLTEGSHCERCGETLVARQTLEAKGHSHHAAETVPPTEDAPGYTVYKCADCEDEYKADYVYNVEGDVNGDYVLNVIDMSLTARYIAQRGAQGTYDLSACDLDAMDMNGDGVIDQLDLNEMGFAITK